MSKEVIAAASFYKQKYFMNPKFSVLPKDIKTEIQALSICSAEKIRGVFVIGFYDNGDIYIEAQREENDFEYDEINAELVSNNVLTEKEELIKALKIWFQTISWEKSWSTTS